MKLALQTCRSLKDFEHLLNTIPKPSGLDANFGVIDAFGGAAFYETGNYRFVKYDAKDNNHPQDALMWSILGSPLTSVAVPVWISGGDQLPRAVSLDDRFRSPLCMAALKFKEQCFPITYDKGTNYVDLAVVYNLQNNGYTQLLQPIEAEIFEKSNLLSTELGKGEKSAKEISEFYNWVDQYLSSEYKRVFNVDLGID